MKALCHSRPLRLCVQIENAPLPLERPKLIGTIRTSRESLIIVLICNESDHLLIMSGVLDDKI